jgi:hypothetical protein
MIMTEQHSDETGGDVDGLACVRTAESQLNFPGPWNRIERIFCC